MDQQAKDILAKYGVKSNEVDEILAKYGVEMPNAVKSTAPTTTQNTTRADGAGVGGNGYEIQMPKLEVELPQIRAFGAADYPAPNLGRVGNVLAAAGTGTAAGFVETAGQMTQPQGLTIGESARVALQGGTRAQEQAAEQEKAQRIRENIKDPLYATADRLTEQSAAYTEKAKEGLGEVGQFAVDLGVTGTQMLGDMALGLINPVLGTGAMATRVFGGSAQEARQAGATETEQQLYGLGSAATSVLAEKITNVGKAFKTAYGGSIAGGKVDDLLTKLTGKLMKNPAGQRILASAAGEAGEEALEALLQPALQAIYDKGATLNKTWFGSTEELLDYLTEVGYNALLGGALGALGGGGDVTAPVTTQTAQGGAEAAQEAAQEAPTAGNEPPTPSTGAERALRGIAEAIVRGGYAVTGDAHTIYNDAVRPGIGQKAAVEAAENAVKDSDILPTTPRTLAEIEADVAVAQRALDEAEEAQQYADGTAYDRAVGKSYAAQIRLAVLNYEKQLLQTEQGSAEAAQEAQDAPAAGNEPPAPSTGAERPQNGAQRPTWGAYMEDGDIFGGGRKTRAGFTSLENAMANQFERETGISIDSVESILGGLANGDYNSANWVARIAQDAKDPKMVVVAHELTHHLQTLAPQEYESFRTAVADYFTRAGGEGALTDMMNRYRSAYGAAGQNLSDSAVMDEMAADFTEVLLTDADLFGKFARQNRTLAEQLLDALRAFIEKIRATFTGRERDAAAQEATGKTLNELEIIAEQWQGVYSAAAAAYGQNANTATQEGNGVRYSVNNIEKSFGIKSINDYVGVQKSVINTLENEGFFNGVRNITTNRAGNMVVEITKDGIRETLGPDNRFSSLPRALKELKLATIRSLPEIIAAAEVTTDSAPNFHSDNSKVKYAYLKTPVTIDGVPYEVTVTVRRSPQKNKFWVHEVRAEKKKQDLSSSGGVSQQQEYNKALVSNEEGAPQTLHAAVNQNAGGGEANASSEIRLPNLSDGVKGNLSQLKSTASLRQMMAEMPQQVMIRMPRLTTVAQDEAEAAGLEAAPVEDTVLLPQLGFTDADVPGTEPLTRQDIARELAWRARMANEPAAPQVMGEVKLPDLSEDMEEAGMGVADFTGNVETVPQEATAEILSALEDLSRDMEAPMETPTDATVRDAEGLISAETVEAPQSLKEKAAESWAFFKRKMVDSGEAVTQIGKAINDKYLYPFYNMARASASAGANMIAEEQTDVNGRTVGESLNAIFDPIRAKGKDYYVNFQTYMYDLHNIARMSMDQKAKQEQETAEAALAAYTADHPKFINMTEAQAQRQADSIDELEAEEAQEYLRLVRWVNRAARMGNKPVFDYDFTAEMSRGRSERLLREHPEFAQYREQVRKYIDNLMKYRVDSGLITQKDANFLRAYYPDYIPTYRRQAFEDFGAEVKKKRVQISKTVGRAPGGNTKLVPLHEALGKQTMQVVREGSKNRFGARLLQDYAANASNADIARYVRDAEEHESDFSIDTFDRIDDVKPERGNTFSVYFNGKLYDMTVDNALFEAVEALSPTATEQNTVTKVVHDVNKLYKALITGYNPTFAIRNTVRDLQTAGLYSRDFAAWAKNYPKALAEIKNDGPMWKQYKALGGDFSSVFDYVTGTVKKPTTKAGKVMDKVQALNMAMEQAPRLAEFMAVMESGDGSMESAMDAMLAAADVTVNFGRSGTWGKMLNANYVPFLNPGIQGFDKMVRYATQSRSGKQWLMMAARAAALGIAPSLINALLYHDDEEWEELRDSDKDTNYMFKLKDGLWLKIPKGRELSVLGIAADRVGDALQGKEVDIRATLNTIANQVAPANPLNQNILKAAYDTQLFDPSSPGRTWYGGDIEGQRLQNYAPGERYDSSTDVVSKAIGGALNLSPKKLNYLADQYTGVVGDIVLPLLTPQAERDMFSKAFTVDSISSNELSSKFYEKSDELTYAKNGGDAVAAVVSRYWNSIGSDVSKLYGKIRDVENSDLSNREKKAQVQELQRQINAIQREALATVDQYTAAVESSLFGDDDDAADFAYRETNREVLGAKYALETYNKDVYAKAQEAAKSGVSYEAYYDYYFATKDIESDKDASGKVIPGSKREKVLAEINAMNLTVEQKNALYYASGYVESTLYEAPWYTIQMPRL